MNHIEARPRRAGPLTARVMRALGPWGQFLRGFIKHPVMVGSIIPSSPRLVDHMLSRVDWSQVRVVVEYGPGVGTFCRPILDRLGGQGRLIAIDTNPDFIAYLSRDIADSRFVPVHGSAADIEAILRAHGADRADLVLSGLPFSTLPKGVGPAIARATARALRPGGMFLVYQFRARAVDFIAPYFNRIDRAFEPVNVPPCFLFWAHADKDSAGRARSVDAAT